MPISHLRLAMDYNEVLPNQSSPSIQNNLPSSTTRIVTSKIPIYLNLKSTIVYQPETTSPSVVNSPKTQEFINPQMSIPASIQSHVNVIPMLIQGPDLMISKKIIKLSRELLNSGYRD